MLTEIAKPKPSDCARFTITVTLAQHKMLQRFEQLGTAIVEVVLVDGQPVIIMRPRKTEVLGTE